MFKASQHLQNAAVLTDTVTCKDIINETCANVHDEELKFQSSAEMLLTGY